MRSPLPLPLAPLLVGCVVLFPRPALAKQVPIFAYRELPTSSPTSTPSYQPSARPSSHPTSSPSFSPSSHPSSQPTSNPSSSPSSQPTLRPSLQPSLSPSLSGQPSSQPTKSPSFSPSYSHQPSLRPSFKPTYQPSLSAQPSSQPSTTPPPPYLSSYTSFMQSVGLSSSPVGFWLAIASAAIFAALVTFGLVKCVRNPQCLCASGRKQSSRNSNDEYDTSSQASEEEKDEEEGEDWRLAVNEMLSYWVPKASPSNDEHSSVASTNPSVERTRYHYAIKSKQKKFHALATSRSKDAQVSPIQSPPRTQRLIPTREDVKESPRPTTPMPNRMDIHLSPSPTPFGRKKLIRGKGREKTPREGHAGQLVRQRTGDLSNAVTEKLDQAITGLSTIGNNTKEFAEKTSRQIGDGASNAAMAIGETSEGILMSLGGESFSSESSADETSLGDTVSSGESSGDDSASSTSTTSHSSRDSTDSVSPENIVHSLLSHEESASSGSSCSFSDSDEDGDDSYAHEGSDKDMKPMATNEHTAAPAPPTIASEAEEISATASYENYVPTYTYSCM